MKIRTVIVDDEAPARRRIKKLLESISDCELIGEAESGSKAIKVIDSLKPDLVLLDIQLKDMTGFEVLNTLKTQALNVIFTTAYDSYAIRAFEENAIDYLLKPYKDARFLEAIERARMRHNTDYNQSIKDFIGKISSRSLDQKIQIPEGKTIHLLESNKIEFIQSNGYYSDFHFEDESTKMIRTSLKSLENILPHHFVRIGKSVIINKHKILSLRHLKSTIELELPNDQKFSLSNKNSIIDRLRND